MDNLVILVADSLRYDYLPQSIRKIGVVSRAIAPGLNTSTSFASLVTGLRSKHHNVRSFTDRLLSNTRTAFDLFPHSEYYDHPLDPMNKVLRVDREKPTELFNMKEPFIWIERMLETHIPYGIIRHGNEIPDVGVTGRQYIRKLRFGELDPEEEYLRGVKKVEEHIFLHIEELKSRGIYENTLTIVCSDHGEILSGLYYDVHNFPPCRQLIEVPVVFVSSKKLPPISRAMRLIDVIPTALDLMGRNYELGDGKSMVKKNDERNDVIIGTVIARFGLGRKVKEVQTYWRCTEDGIEPIDRSLVLILQIIAVLGPESVLTRVRAFAQG